MENGNTNNEGADELDIGTLRDSVAALSTCINVYNDNLSRGDINLSHALRSGVIYNFEVAYEMSWKFMKKWLEKNISPDVVTTVTRKEFYRIAHQHGMITNVTEWWIFHDGRNRTSHTYKAVTAEDVLNIALKFPKHASYLIDFLEDRRC